MTLIILIVPPFLFSQTTLCLLVLQVTSLKRVSEQATVGSDSVGLKYAQSFKC